MKASLIGRVDALQARAAPRSDFDARADEAMRWCERVLGYPFDDLDGDDIHRVGQLMHEAPDFAHPLLLRACCDHPEDREPPQPEGQLSRPTANGPMQWTCPDTPEWRTYQQWQRRRWGYETAKTDPEAQALLGQLEAWAASPDRPYLRGADLRFLLARLGVEQSTINYLELRRLIALCAALDELALEEPELEVPYTVWWAVLGWEEHHLRRQSSRSWR